MRWLGRQESKHRAIPASVPTYLVGRDEDDLIAHGAQRLARSRVFDGHDYLHALLEVAFHRIG